MKKVKFAFWIIMLALFGLLIYQNHPYFIDKHALELNLYFTDERIFQVRNVVMLVVFFTFGLLMAYTSSLIDRFRANKTIKELRAKIRSLQDNLDQVKKDVEVLKTPLSKRENVEIADKATESSDKDESTEAQTAK